MRTLLTIFLSVVLFTTANAQGEMKPFIFDHRNAANSVVDLSFLLDAPAGKRGFARIANGHLVTGDGKRLRLWGVNITDWTRGSTMFPPKADAPMWAATLARLGINCVRLHFLDLAAPRGLIDAKREDTRGFDADQLDRFDFFMAELRKRGIYLNINLNVGRSYKAGDGVKDADKIRWAKGLTLFDARLIELQKEYAKQLLTHRNPYTGLEYRNDPAVVTVEMLNENALYVGFRAPTPAYEQDLLNLYNDWLKRNRTPEQLAKLRELAGVAADAPIPRIQGRDAAPERRYTELEFCMEMERKFYLDMQAYLRDTLKVKAPLVATADHSHSGSSYPMLASTSLLDIVDGHTYWQHPGPRGIPNTPMVNDPLNSTVVELARTAFANKPYTVSETNHPFPNDYAAEGIPILAAYGALQDWDGIFWYTFEPKASADWQPMIGDAFDLSHHPVKLPQLAAGALMFLRGDVQAAKKTIARSYSRQQVADSGRLPATERPFFTPGFPALLTLQHGVRIATLDGKPTEKIEWQAANPLVSDTNELTWTTSAEKGGLVTIETERTQAGIGFIKAHGAHGKALRHLVPQLDNRFASVTLSALDDKPLARSGRLLLTAAAMAGNTGMQWNENRSNLTQSGNAPTVIEPVTGQLLLRNLANARKVTLVALDGRGQPIGAPINAQKAADGWQLQLGAAVTTWYEIKVER